MPGKSPKSPGGQGQTVKGLRRDWWGQSCALEGYWRAVGDGRATGKHRGCYVVLMREEWGPGLEGW